MVSTPGTSDGPGSPRRPRVVLIGPPGAGKTTVADELGRRWGCSVTDTDVLVEQTDGRSVADIFVEDGEPTFRDLERQAVRRALAEVDGVLALGGGAPMQEQVRADLRGHAVVFLDVGIADAAGRIGFDRSRPLLSVNPRARWTALMNERRATYTAVATARVDTSAMTPAAVAAAVEQALEALVSDEAAADGDDAPGQVQS